jgi:hypothetical protein
MSVPFINRGMKHMCAQFADNMLMLYAETVIDRHPMRPLACRLFI